MTRSALTVCFAVAAGCTEDVPANPTFQEDIAPILRANCARCHLPGQRSSPEDFRLSYSGYMLGTRQISGAGAYADAIADRVERRVMPLTGSLEDHQIETIVRWQEQGAERGPARPGNRAPIATIVQSMPGLIVVDLYDPDGDLVGGTLFENGVSTLEVTQGRNDLYLEPGNRVLQLHVDDGGAEYDFDLGTSP